jgi:ABC-2 type transport system permease protein
MTRTRTTAPGTAPLRSLDERGWRRGFGNLLRNEIGAWTQTRTWWVQFAVWIGILNGLLLLPLVFLRDAFVTEAGGPLASATEMFFSIGGLAPAIGIVILTHGAIITERQLGTAAWVLSKPVSRTAFVLAKFLANALGILMTAILVPGAIAYLVLSLENGAPLALGPFAAASGLIAAGVLFYLTLTLMLGTFLRTRGPVLAIPLVLLIAGDGLIGIWPALANAGTLLPGRLAMLVAQGTGLLSVWPVIATLAWTVVFLSLALWRFAREEF